MTSNTLRALLAAVLVVCLVGVAAGGTLAQDDAPEPEMEVVYDEFRTDDAVVESANMTGSAQAIKQNTRATIEDDDAFVRVGLENPNSYAVAFEVQISNELVKPATLGTVRAVENDDVTANWQAQHDFEAEETHTKVTVVVPAETDVLFTPSQLRVKSLSWTGEAEQSADTIRDRVTKLWEEDRLKQRTYEVTGSEGEIVTVDLENPETGDRIEEWHATYTLAGAETPQPTPLAEGTGEPVFYRPIENDDGAVNAIQVTFNEPGTVSLTVEPTATERIGYEVTSYRSSVLDGFEWGPFTAVGVTP
ncbi:hypothetical protein C471_09375 [Halorubrum saccharovorum DSM 1137]|uniref:Uncharacterized protein n=1 Tax=Halorubrum saccharovorum DSM 1137 TaxID=1227484 RepID=M0DTF1_9EURY|nr:hypothetical protein [Halorubrum saccharovorum]ELZ38770.1 hypothetical protein C471_09375 [Halorubrum saccharovorum DSM 1137]